MSNSDQGNCVHKIQYNQICRKNIKVNKNGEVKGHTKIICSAELEFAEKEIKQLKLENTIRLLQERKLILVVDLDQTIIHVTCERKDNHSNNINVVEDIRQFQLSESDYIYYLKLRPGLQDILSKLSKLYELYVYTMGTQEYAKAILKEVDPNDIFFQGRIMTREENKQKSLSDNGNEFKKRLDRLFSHEKSLAAIIDDRFDVWDFSSHLVHIKPYFFFKGTGDINNPDTTYLNNNLNRNIHFNQDDDGELFETLNVLTKIHNNFYQDFDKKVEQYEHTLTTCNPFEIIPNIADFIGPFRSHVFNGFHIAFSKQDPKLSYYWKIAELFGATCHTSLSEKVTHLVTGVAKIDMIHEAVRYYPRVNIINPHWLYDSISLQNIQNENIERYLVDQFTTTFLNLMEQNDSLCCSELAVSDMDIYSFDSINWTEVDSFLDNIDSNSYNNKIDNDKKLIPIVTDNPRNEIPISNLKRKLECLSEASY
ncbi:unnamed protein product [Cunninghamella blakesleeana]